MRTTPLHRDFGVEIHDVDLRAVDAATYAAIRDAFERHSLLMFRGQALGDDDILRLGRMFGPIENRTSGPVHVSPVSNVAEDGTVIPRDALDMLNLKANMLWHTDSTFLPVPALANIITARVVPDEGGTTELVSTRAGFARLPEAMRAEARAAVLRHRISHSRAQISPELARQERFTKWADQLWRAVWPNPVTGDEALYIASHACAVEGREDGQALIDALIGACTRPEDVYAHRWRLGDVLIWDERATLHRGQPWPDGQARTLASICVSAGAADGLAAVTPG